MASSVNDTLLYKLLLIGDTGVGKTCMIVRYVDETFRVKLIATVGEQFGIATHEPFTRASARTIKGRQRQLSRQVGSTWDLQTSLVHGKLRSHSARPQISFLWFRMETLFRVVTRLFHYAVGVYILQEILTLFFENKYSLASKTCETLLLYSQLYRCICLMLSVASLANVLQFDFQGVRGAKKCVQIPKFVTGPTKVGQLSAHRNWIIF